MDTKELKRNFWLFGGLGSLLFGFGLCLLLESGFLKHGNAENWKWIALGTLSLTIIITGLNFLFKSFEYSLKLKS